MIKEIDFKRKEIFSHYHEGSNPFIIITVPIEVTNIVNYCKLHKHFYATMGYLITKTCNDIDSFKYRYQNGKFYYCDILKSNYTQMKQDGDIGYFSVPYNEDYNEYIKEQTDTEYRFINNNKYETGFDLDEVWLSCVPWFNFTGLVPPFNKEVTVPQFIWDKYQLKDDKYYLNLTILVHHGFADGSHIATFIKKLETNINNFNKE